MAESVQCINKQPVEYSIIKAIIIQVLTKLQSYGVKDNVFSWFKTYLSNRTQLVMGESSISIKNRCSHHSCALCYLPYYQQFRHMLKGYVWRL